MTLNLQIFALNGDGIADDSAAYEIVDNAVPTARENPGSVAFTDLNDIYQVHACSAAVLESQGHLAENPCTIVLLGHA